MHVKTWKKIFFANFQCEADLTFQRQFKVIIICIVNSQDALYAQTLLQWAEVIWKAMHLAFISKRGAKFN